MSELQIAKVFLAALDNYPAKLPADFAEDARAYPARTPYIMPRMPKPMQKANRAKIVPGQERSVVVIVKSLHRNPPLDVKLGSLPLSTTSLLDVRTALAAQSHVPADKLRLLYQKKPIADSKVLKDLVGDETTETFIELGVMVMGGATAVAAAVASYSAGKNSETGDGSSPTAPQDVSAKATGGAAADGAESEAFWTDLRGFLLGRLKDERQADELFSLFLRAWDDRSP